MKTRGMLALLSLALGMHLGCLGSQAGNEPRRAANLDAFAQSGVARPVAGPDGRFAFLGLDTALLRIDLTSGNVSAIASGHFGRLALSSDGSRLVFHRRSDGVTRLWTAPVDTVIGSVGAPQTLVSEPSRSPSISPDGQWIAFTLSFADAESLAVVSREGGRVRVLPASGPELEAVGWSADGRTVFYEVGGGPPFARNYPVYGIELEGSANRLVIPLNLSGARTSPDGRFIAYKPSTDSVAVAHSTGEFVAGFGVSRERTIGPLAWTGRPLGLFYTSLSRERSLISYSTLGSDSIVLHGEGSYTAFPAVSPDGRRVAAITTRNGKSQLVVRHIDAVADDAKLITTRAKIAYAPMLSWSPDGRYVAITTGNVERPIHANATGIDVVDVETGRVHSLATAPELQRPTWRPDGGAIRYVHSPADTAGVQVPMEIRETSIGGPDRLVNRLHRSRGGVIFVDYNHAYSWADGVLVDLTDGATKTFLDTVEFSTPTPCVTSGGELLASQVRSNRGGPFNRVKIMSLTTGSARFFETVHNQLRTPGFRCVRDTPHLVVTSIDTTGASWASLLSLDGEPGRPIARIDSDREGIEFTVTPDGQRLLVSRRIPAQRMGLLHWVLQPARTR